MDELLQHLPGSEGASLTLEEALDLLGSFDALSDLDDVLNEPPQRPTRTDEVSQPTATNPKKRVRNPLNDVRRRQRRKAERLQLKEQVREYEALLERLERARNSRPVSADGDQESGSHVPAPRPDSPWLQAVLEEERKRRKTEKVNDKLKSLLAERMQMAGAIRSVLLKESARLTKIDRCMELRLSLQSCSPQPGFTEYGFTSPGLHGTVHQVFKSTDSVLGPISVDAFTSCESISRVKNDRATGTCVELLTTTPLACELPTARSILWEEILNKQWPEAQSRFSLKTKECSSQSVELRYSMSFESPQRDPLILDGASLLEKRDEEHRTILAWTSLILHPSEQLRFRSHGWIVVMKSPTDPETSSVVRTCCRVSAEHTNSGLRQTANHEVCLAAAQNGILRSMGQRLKSRLEVVQRHLLERAGPQELIVV